MSSHLTQLAFVVEQVSVGKRRTRRRESIYPLRKITYRVAAGAWKGRLLVLYREEYSR